MQAVDTVRRQPKQTITELDSPECISTLHTLYSMTLTAVGKSPYTCKCVLSLLHSVIVGIDPGFQKCILEKPPNNMVSQSKY